MSLSGKLITALTVITLVIILIGIYATYSAFTKTFIEVEIIFGLLLQTVMIVLCVAVCTAFLLGVWLVIEEIRSRKQKRLRFAPSEQGYYEALLTSDGFCKPADNIPLQVPSTYSPRIHISGEIGKQLPALSDINVTHTPSLETIIEELTPNVLEFIYGMDRETGELVKTTLPEAVHIQLIGATTMGKSHQASSIITQLVTKNEPTIFNLAFIDHEGETTAPFRHLPHVKYLASDPKEAARTLRELIRELEVRDITKQKYPVILVFVEEFLNLRRIMPDEIKDDALEHYTTIALRGAKRGVYLLSIGQTAYTQKHIRDAQMQFLSLMAFAIKPSAARSAGFTNTPLLNQLYAERKPAQFLLERPAGDAILLAPQVDYRHISTLFGQTKPEENIEPLSYVESSLQPQNKSARKSIEPALEAKLTQVCMLLSQQVNAKGDIIFAVWKKKPGKNEQYYKAEEEYNQIMAYLAGLHHE